MMQSALHILNHTYGYADFRLNQRDIIDSVLQGQHTLALMPTGGGKSLCYQVPALVRDGVGVIVSPLIALMQDQVDALRLLGIAADYLNSSLSVEQRKRIERALLAGELKVLYVAPESLLSESMLSLLARVQATQGLSLFAIDEAHCVSQWGHDFRPEYRQLSRLVEVFPTVPRIALTATVDDRIRQFAHDKLVVFGLGATKLARYGQAMDYFVGIKEADLPRYVLVRDFARFALTDLEKNETITFFGSLFQSIMDSEARRNLGAHYTSEENILKLIKPLFLDDLWAEFDKNEKNKTKLLAFHDKLASLTFFDPACSCGNFLVITYRELRKLEREVLKKLYKNDQQISEHFGTYFARIPLKKSANIVNGNALQTDWHSVCPNASFIVGNPPFIGKNYRNKQQDADMARVFTQAFINPIITNIQQESENGSNHSLRPVCADRQAQGSGYFGGTVGSDCARYSDSAGWVSDQGILGQELVCYGAEAREQNNATRAEVRGQIQPNVLDDNRQHSLKHVHSWQAAVPTLIPSGGGLSAEVGEDVNLSKSDSVQERALFFDLQIPKHLAMHEKNH